MQVSYDGATWQRTTLRLTGDQRWMALLKHPKDATLVSLRATARDSEGNSVEQTVIPAYGLR